MESSNLTLDLKQASTDLLNNYDQPDEVKRIIDSVHGNFREITEMSNYGSSLQYLAAVRTASGMALSLNHAAECLIDYRRTIQFLRGIVAAIHQKQKDHPDETIHIFYAGCGPYAPFVTLVAPLFSTEEVQFSLLEINRDSLDLAKKLITTLGLDGYVENFYQADAVTFKIPNPESVHILFSETLDALLYRESYVPILMNMLPQISNETALIPQNVLLKLNFGTLSNTNISEEIGQEVIFDTRLEVEKYNRENSVAKEFPPIEFNLDRTLNYQYMLLDTEVHVYDSLKLIRGESSLTLPYNMPFEQPLKFNKLTFAYELQPQVELKCDFE
jgi:predicted RNA methylase